MQAGTTACGVQTLDALPQGDTQVLSVSSSHRLVLVFKAGNQAPGVGGMLSATWEAMGC